MHISGASARVADASSPLRIQRGGGVVAIRDADPPDLLAFELENKDIVRVGVRDEHARTGCRYVDVEGDGGAELAIELRLQFSEATQRD
jgi:hypothetical protein